MKIYGNLTHANFMQDQLTLLVKSDHVVVEKLGNSFGSIFQLMHFSYYKTHSE